MIRLLRLLARRWSVILAEHGRDLAKLGSHWGRFLNEDGPISQISPDLRLSWTERFSYLHLTWLDHLKGGDLIERTWAFDRWSIS